MAIRVSARVRRSGASSSPTTKATRLSASNPANGIVTWLTEGFNQRDELVINFERSNLVRLRHPPEMGGTA